MGGRFGTYGDGGVVEAIYFTSEAEARDQEKMAMPDDLRSLFDEEQQLAGEVTYYNMHHPMLVSAAH